MANELTRAFRFNKYGLTEDPRGAQVTWTVRDRIFLADVIDYYRNEVTGATMLKVRHFNGEPMPDVAAVAVRVLVRTFETTEE